MTTATLSTSAGLLTVAATEPVPGLLVYEIPAEVSPLSRYRWILGHHDGQALASFETEPAAVLAAEKIAPLTDWTRSAMTTANQISFSGKPGELMRLLNEAGGQHPNA